MSGSQPPFIITPAILRLVAEISESLGRLSALTEQENALRLRRINRIRTIQGSLAIEGNTLSEAQITAILQGKRVIAPPREVQEARNAIAAYDQLPHWQASREQHRRNSYGTTGEPCAGADGAVVRLADHYRPASLDCQQRLSL